MRDQSEQSSIERLRAELEALRESEEKYRLLMDTTDTGFVILDETGRVLDANEVYVRLTGHDRLEQILGRPVTDWTASGDAARNAEEVRRCLAEGAVRNLEIEYCGRDGRSIPVEINATVRRLPSGPTILTVCREASERRRAEQAVRHTEERYRTTIDSMVEFIHVVDTELRIVLVNRTGREWMERLSLPTDLIGRRVFDVFPFLSEQVREEYRRIFAGEGTLITRERQVVSGEEIVTETRKIPIVEDGTVVRVVTVIRDVSEEVRAQERLRQSEKMNALGQLAGGIAHDFNNQLTAILGYAQLLERHVQGRQLREYAETIGRLATRSSDLTRQLLAFARKGRIGSESIDLHGLLREVAGMLSRTVDPRISLHTHLDAAEAEIVGDAGQLQSAFLNLGLNARDAMPEGGDLTLRTDLVTIDEVEARGLRERFPSGRYLRVRVEDTGIGMSEEVRRRLFEPFFTTKGPDRGTGMGLAALYGTITSHQGAIRVESAPGRGSTFTVLLPLAPRQDGMTRSTAAAAPPTGRGHVLLADDQPAVLQVTAQMLSELGYRVTTRGDGVAALDFFREAWREVDLVFLDVMMPALPGPRALLEMRRIDPTVPAILCSGRPLGPDDGRLLGEEGVHFLEKPFTIKELATRVGAAMEAAGSRRA